MKNILFAFFCENHIKILKAKRWQWRLLDVLYRLVVTATILSFITIYIIEDIYESIFATLYALMAMTTVLTAGIVGYHLLIYVLIYIIYGKDNFEYIPKSINPNEYFITWATIYLIFGSLLWIAIGA